MRARASLFCLSLLAGLLSAPVRAQDAADDGAPSFPDGYASWASETRSCGSGDIAIEIVGYRSSLQDEQVTEYKKDGAVFGVFMNSPPWSTLYSIPSFNDGALGYFGPFDDETEQTLAMQTFRNAVSDNPDTTNAVLIACEAIERQTGKALFDRLLANTEAIFPDYAEWEMRERQCNDTLFIRAYGTESQRVYETRLAGEKNRLVLAQTRYPAVEQLFIVKTGDSVSLYQEGEALFDLIRDTGAAALGLEHDTDQAMSLLQDCEIAMMNAGMELIDHFREGEEALDEEIE